MLRPIRVVPLLFVLLGIVTLLEHQISARLSWLNRGRFLFAESLGQTRARLVNGVWQAVRDQAIQQNIELNNLNTVGQSLQNYLRAGEISQMELVDVDCNLLARVPQSDRPIHSGCRGGLSSDATLLWQRSPDGLPTLSVSVPKIVAGKKYQLVAHVILDQAWLSVYHDLAALVGRHDFSLFENSTRGLIWAEGVDASGEALATIRVDGWLSRLLLPNFMHYSLEQKPSFFWWFYMLCGAVLTLILFKAGVAERRDQEQRNQVQAWLKQKCSSVMFRDLKIVERDGHWLGIATQMQAMIDRIATQKQQQVRLLRERQDQLSLGSVQRDREISELQERLAGMSDLSSLKEQLQHSTQSFLSKMEEVRELCENMFDVASSGLAKQSKALHEFHIRWKTGIADETHRERGARKFFRSLSETASVRPGKTKLDDELDELGELTSATLDQSLHMAMTARQVLSELEAGVQVAGLWHGLAMRDSQRQKTCDWVDCLLSAQRLVVADNRYATLSFERMPTVGNPEETYSPVPKVALVSGMFHLYMALLADVTVEAIHLPIVLRQKRFHDHGTIILSLPQPAADVADAGPGRSQSYHLELAKAILAPLGIKVAFLPPTVAGVPVALTWNLPGKEVDVKATPSKHGEDMRAREAELNLDL